MAEAYKLSARDPIAASSSCQLIEVINMNLTCERLIHLFTTIACFTLLVGIQAQQPEPAKNSGSISGHVTVDGKPKAGLMVELLTTITNGPRRVIAKATTNKTGKHLLISVASGTTE